MAEVLSGIGSLFGTGQNLQQMQQGFGMIKPGETANPLLKTPLVLSPQNYQAMEQAKNPYSINQDLQTAAPLMQNILKNAQQNKLSPMQLSAPGQMSSIQQQDLMSLLRNLGGGY